jgi:hypothetical protein
LLESISLTHVITGVLIAIAAFSCWEYISHIKTVPGEHRLRTAGVSRAGYHLIQFFLAVFGLTVAYEVFALWMNLDWRIDLAVLAFVFGLYAVVWTVLSLRPTFKAEKVAGWVFAPLGIGSLFAPVAFLKWADAVPTVLRQPLYKVADQLTPLAKNVLPPDAALKLAPPELASVAGRAATTSPSPASQGLGTAAPAIRNGLTKNTVAGFITFPHTNAIGGIGDQLTARHYANFCDKLPSKFKTSKGIDGVYAETRKDGSRVLHVIENKVDGGRLAEGQMSDGWIRVKISEMRKYGDNRVRSTADELEHAIDEKSGVTINKILISYDLSSGEAIFSKISPDGIAQPPFRIGNFATSMKKVLLEAVSKNEWEMSIDEVLAEIP